MGKTRIGVDGLSLRPPSSGVFPQHAALADPHPRPFFMLPSSLGALRSYAHTPDEVNARTRGSGWLSYEPRELRVQRESQAIERLLARRRALSADTAEASSASDDSDDSSPSAVGRRIRSFKEALGSAASPNENAEAGELPAAQIAGELSHLPFEPEGERRPPSVHLPLSVRRRLATAYEPLLFGSVDFDALTSESSDAGSPAAAAPSTGKKKLAEDNVKLRKKLGECEKALARQSSHTDQLARRLHDAEILLKESEASITELREQSRQNWGAFLEQRGELTALRSMRAAFEGACFSHAHPLHSAPELNSSSGSSDSDSSLRQSRQSSPLRQPPAISGRSGSPVQASGSLPRARKNLRVPVPTVWTGTKEEDVEVFLPRIAHYFTESGVDPVEWPVLVQSFLGDRAFQLWHLELQNILASGSATWEHFCQYMRDSFGSVAPERKARKRYETLRQKDDVESFITELKACIRIMKPLPMIAPSEGDIVRRFLDGCKPDLQKFLTENTPHPYWKDAEQVFRMAIDRSANRVDESRTVPPPKHMAAMAGEKPKNKRSHRKRRAGRAAGQQVPQPAHYGPPATAYVPPAAGHAGGNKKNKRKAAAQPRENNRAKLAPLVVPAAEMDPAHAAAAGATAAAPVAAPVAAPMMAAYAPHPGMVPYGAAQPQPAPYCFYN